MNGPFVSASVILFLSVLASPAEARQLTAGPDALLSNGDVHRQEQAVQNALEYNKTGDGTSWANPETGHRGKVTPILTYKNSAGQNCRKYQRSMLINGRAAIGRGTRCRTPNGVWKIPRLISSHWHPYYEPYYRHYHRPYYPFTIHLGYYYGRFFGHRRHRHHRHRRRHR